MRLDKTSALALCEVGKTNVWPMEGNRSEAEKRYMNGRGVALGALAVAERMPGATSLHWLCLRADQGPSLVYRNSRKRFQCRGQEMLEHHPTTPDPHGYGIRTRVPTGTLSG